ncbi:MAG: DUF927 domain-containing protein, partial [Chthonomonadales bacterium]
MKINQHYKGHQMTKDNHNIKAGEFGEFEEHTSTVRVLQGIEDQLSRKWFEISDSKNSCWIQARDFRLGSNAAAETASEYGVNILHQKTLTNLRDQITEWRNFKQATVATHQGHYDGIYIHGDGTVVRPEGFEEREVIIRFTPNAKSSTKGTLAEWLEAMTPFLDGQDLLKVIFCLPFVGALLRILDQTVMAIQNFGVELYGDTSTGKTNVCRAAASALGGRNHRLGFLDSWYTTPGGLVLYML